MECPKCKSKNVEVNGLYYQCQDCGDLDDSTFSMITEDNKFIKKELGEK
jgi:hypothetical protein